MSEQTLSEFESEARERGFDEVVERRWQPLQETGTHSHPFSVEALVVAGEMWLSVGEATRHLRPGDRFELDRDVPHAERYGSEGATYWAARRSGAAA